MSETPDGETVLDSEAVSKRATRNGHHPSQEGDAFVRAEEMFDRLGESVGRSVAGAGKWLNRFALRLKEESEDMMVEAQDLRSRWRSHS